MRFARCLLFGAVFAAASCRSATPASSPSSAHASSPSGAVFAVSHADTSVAVIDGSPQLAAFNLEVPLPTDTGVCVRRPVPLGIGELVSVYYPGVRNAAAVASVNVDTAGHIIRYSERRGEVSLDAGRRLTRQELDSAITATRLRTRSSTIYLDYGLGHALLTNEGGGRKTESIMARLTAVANDPRFGAPDARARAIVARCGTVPLTPLRGAASSPVSDERKVLMRSRADTNTVYRANPSESRPYFEFQVDKQAKYVGDSSVSPHPSRTGSGALVQFTVDSTGMVQPQSFKVLRMNDSALVADARMVLARWRFTPAEVGGRKVSQLVQTEIVR